jgi:hypothetical protein
MAKCYTPREFCDAKASIEGLNGKSVFLAGVTSPTSSYESWRDELIPHFLNKGISCVNPVDPQWTTDNLQHERDALELCDSIYCLLSDDALCVISLMELVANREKEVVVITKEMKGNLWFGEKGEGDNYRDCTGSVNYARKTLSTYIPRLKLVEVQEGDDMIAEGIKAVINT